MLDPLMWDWIKRTGTVIEKDGKKIILPPIHWPDGQPITYLGVMADEVEKIYPDAVFEVNGIKTVDYEKLITRIQNANS